MNAQCSAAALDWLQAHSRLPGAQARAVAALVPRLLACLPEGRVPVVGIAGAPGTGKSTLARVLGDVLGRHGNTVPVLSLDDYYLASAERRRLADRIHPLFATRGVPGTHDLERLCRDLDVLRAGRLSRIAVPRFDKTRDEPAPRPRVVVLTGEPRAVFLEGWLIGAPPEPPEDLSTSLNELERRYDPDVSWRKAVNERLAEYHDALGERLSRSWYLRAPDWDSVVEWRWRQERERPRGRRHLPDRAAVEGFLAHYQRLCAHMDRSCTHWANVVVDLDREHMPKIREAA